MSNLNTNPFLNRPGNNQPAVPRESTAPFTLTPGSTPAPSPMEPQHHGRHSAPGSGSTPVQSSTSTQPQIPMDNTLHVAGDSPKKTASPFEVPVGPTAAPYGLQAEPPQVQEEAVTAAVDGDHPLGLPYYDCPMGDAVIRFFQNYAKFSGRASRSEFWWVVLATVIASTIFVMLSAGFPGIMGNVFAILFIVFELSIIVPSLALMTRRAHDSNMSGWWVFGYYAANALTGSLAASAFIQALTPSKMIVIENYEQYGALSQMSINSGAVTMMGVSSLLSLVTLVLFFVITLRKPRPEGVRFDKQYIPTPPTDLGSNGGTKTAGSSPTDSDSFSNILD